MILTVTCPENHHHQYGKLCVELTTGTFIYWCPICNKTYKIPIVDYEKIFANIKATVLGVEEKEVKDAKDIGSGGGGSSVTGSPNK